MKEFKVKEKIQVKEKSYPIHFHNEQVHRDKLRLIEIGYITPSIIE